MAALTLDRDETGSDFLPARCMRCGAATEEYKEKNFVWSHPALVALVLLGLPGIILMLILRAVLAKRMTVDVPVCPRHRHQWAVSTGIVVTLLIGIIAMMIVYAVSHREIEQRFGASSFFVILIVLPVSLVVMAVVANLKVRPTKIDADEIQFAGVSAAYADEVREKQRAEREAVRARRNPKRDGEPVYDDDPAY